MTITATFGACIRGTGTTAHSYAVWHPVRHSREACVSVSRAASPQTALVNTICPWNIRILDKRGVILAAVGRREMRRSRVVV